MKKIRSSLIISISAIALVISVALGGVSIYLLSTAATQGMETSVTSAAKAYAKAVQNQTAIYLTEVKSMANDSRIGPKSSLDEMNIVAADLSKKSDFRLVAFANAQGVPYDRPDISITTRDYFKSAIAGVPYMSAPLISKKDNSVVLYAAAKVNNGIYDGIVFGELSNDVFSKIVQDVSIGKKGFGYIIDKTGTIIAHKDNKLVESLTNYITLADQDKKFAGLSAFTSTILKNQNGTMSTKVNGPEQYVAYTPIGGTDGWILVMAADRAEMMQTFNQGVSLSILMTAIFLILSILFAIIFSNSIGKPITLLNKRLGLLSQGDLNSPVPSVKSKNEVGQLASSMSSTVKNLRDYIQDIHNVLSNITNGNLDVSTKQEYVGDFVDIKTDMNGIIDALNDIMVGIASVSEQVASGSGMVSNSSTALSQGATEQASAIQELSASIEEIASQTRRNAENAETVDKLSLSARDNAAGGNMRMKDMLTAMEEINESSAKIGKIIKVIDDIAFQTNILALNAAVEAARAGQHGKGFAVVAEEVRTLAAKSANAANETTDLIETSIRKVEAGTKIARETADALGNIVREVDRVAELVATISSASQEQAGSIEQIKSGVSQISQVVQTTAATAEESAAASVELSQQAEQLQQTVSVFKVKVQRQQGQAESRKKAPPVQKRTAQISLGSGDFGKY